MLTPSFQLSACPHHLLVKEEGTYRCKCGAEVRSIRFRGRCLIPGCDGKSLAHQLCPKHYYRWKRHGDPNVVLNSVGKSVGKPVPICSIPGCARIHKAKGFCRAHYNQMWYKSHPHHSKRHREANIEAARQYEREWKRKKRAGEKAWMLRP